MKTTPEHHKIHADYARRMAENLEAGARMERLPEWERARYAELARMERLSQAYHEEAAQLCEQGLPVPEWIDWMQARERERP